MRFAVILFVPSAIVLGVCLLVSGLLTANLITVGRAEYYLTRVFIMSIAVVLVALFCDWRVLELVGKVFPDNNQKNNS